MSLGQRPRPAEVEIAGNDHLRQADRARNAVRDADVCRVVCRRWKGAASQVAAASASLRKAGPKLCVSLMVRTLANGWKTLPNPECCCLVRRARARTC